MSSEKFNDRRIGIKKNFHEKKVNQNVKFITKVFSKKLKKLYSWGN